MASENMLAAVVTLAMDSLTSAALAKVDAMLPMAADKMEVADAISPLAEEIEVVTPPVVVAVFAVLAVLAVLAVSTVLAVLAC